MARIKRTKDGVWHQPIKTGFKLACCDCGLIHNVDFRVHSGKIQFRFWRNKRSTGQMRRWINDNCKSYS